MALALDGVALGPGFHPDIPMDDYLALDAIGSSHLGWLSVSPLHYRYMRGQPSKQTEALARGTALHMAVLEPEKFARIYVGEPIESGGNGSRPRATSAYREAVAELEERGHIVMRAEMEAAVKAMASAVLSHPKARGVLEKAPQREITLLWERDGHVCRGRTDAKGSGVIVDLKTTRNLARFSPHVIQQYAYHVQSGWYVDGRERLGENTEHYFLIAVDVNPPHDVGVFALDQATVIAGRMECEALMDKLNECERTGDWPGMYPDVQPGFISDASLAEIVEGDATNG